jgi:hypothetical protein
MFVRWEMDGGLVNENSTSNERSNMEKVFSTRRGQFIFFGFSTWRPSVVAIS